ncbi:hypothetical protein A2U01_0075872, partial [Trifolium medium]|nr:hypothetical protein [Trifolium medium]
MEMMRIAKDVEDELNEEDDDVDKRGSGKKNGYERLGQSEWASKNRSGLNSKDLTRFPKP